MDEKLTELWAKASNAPTEPRPPGARNHDVVSAIAKGFAPVIKQELDGLRAENANLRAENERLRTEFRAEIATIRAVQTELRADISELLTDGPRYSGAATPRRLSS